jgi:hypothetical protein
MEGRIRRDAESAEETRSSKHHHFARRHIHSSSFHHRPFTSTTLLSSSSHSLRSSHLRLHLSILVRSLTYHLSYDSARPPWRALHEPIYCDPALRNSSDSTRGAVVVVVVVLRYCIPLLLAVWVHAHTRAYVRATHVHTRSHRRHAIDALHPATFAAFCCFSQPSTPFHLFSSRRFDSLLHKLTRAIALFKTPPAACKRATRVRWQATVIEPTLTACRWCIYGPITTGTHVIDCCMLHLSCSAVVLVVRRWCV